jgi:hypothetical protein
MSRPEESPACPSCGSDRVAWIFYGLPLSFESLQPELDAGRIILGGCDCSESDPQWQCQACGHGWGRLEIFDNIFRLCQEASASPQSRWRRLGGWLGFIEDDDPVDGKKAPLIGGLARRLAYVAAGAGVVRLLGSLAPPWVGLVVLAVWFLPLLVHVGFRQCAVLLIVPMVGIGGFGVVDWRVVGFVGVTLLEECVLVLTVALLGGWLL